MLEQFRSELAAAGIADRYQYDLYLRQGMDQLRQFFECARDASAPEVIETELNLNLQVGSAKLAGRVDRIDRTGPDTVASWTTKPASRSRRTTPTRACNFPYMRSRPGKRWAKRADRLIFHNLENNTTVSTARNDAELEEAKIARA